MIPSLNANSIHRCLILILCVFTYSFSAVTAEGWNGKISGVKTWRLPNTPNGLVSTQNWHATGSDPQGNIYTVGCDHATNSALFRLTQNDDILTYVGDAVTASQTANNWQTGETCQKFHTRPTYMNGRVYVATLDRSTIDNAYLQTRGYHLYAYDIAKSSFTDLSAAEPNGVGYPKLQIATLSPDPKNNLVYAYAIPTCEVTAYSAKSGLTQYIGKPSSFIQYVYGNRFMFVDSRGRLYISGGNENTQWYNNEPASVYNHLYYYNPGSGFVSADNFALQGGNALEAGQWNRDHSKCYTMDDKGHVYCFTDQGPAWQYLGLVQIPVSKTWILELSADEKTLYIGTSDYGSTKTFHMFDLATKKTTILCTTQALDDQVDGMSFITGYDTWDRNGNFYFSSFTMNTYTLLSRINPVKVKVTKGLLPELVEVNLAINKTNDTLTLSRTGATTQSCEVLFEAAGLNADNIQQEIFYGKVSVPSGSQSIRVPVSQIVYKAPTTITKAVVSVTPDGNDYVAGVNKSVSYTFSSVSVFDKSSSKSGSTVLQIRKGKSGVNTIQMNITKEGKVKLSVLSLDGKVVHVLSDCIMRTGIHEIVLPKESIGDSQVSVIRMETARGTTAILAGGGLQK